MKIKKIKRNLVLTAFLCGIVGTSAANAQSSQATTQQAAVNWAKQQVGHAIDYDHAYGVQCVDLIKAYYHYLGVTPPIANAYQFATIALPQGWQRIDYRVGMVPKAGDIAVWSRNEGGGYGHVDLVVSANAKTFQAVDQNWNGKASGSLVTHDYQQIVAFIRPNLVFPDYSSLSVKDSKLLIDTKWQASSNFVSATNQDKVKLGVGQVKVTTNLNPNKVGTYHVTFSNGKLQKTANIFVVNYASLALKNTTIALGSHWNAAQNFVEAKNTAGKAVSLSAVKVTTNVNPHKAGVYTVFYSIGGISKKASVTVKNYANVELKNTTIALGSHWSAAQNFIAAKNSAGQAVALSAVKVSGKVDTKKAGVYQLHYSIGGVSKKATVTVKNYASLKVKNTTLALGSHWNAKQNFVSATNSLGKTEALSAVKVSGKVDTKKSGVYTVTYQANGLTRTAKVTVKNYSSLHIKNSTLKRGAKWQASMNFVSATNAQNVKLTLHSVKVSGTVNTHKAGNYKVVYSVSGLHAIATITVK